MKRLLSLFSARRTTADGSSAGAARPATGLPSSALSATDTVRLLPVTVDRDDAPCVVRSSVFMIPQPGSFVFYSSSHYFVFYKLRASLCLLLRAVRSSDALIPTASCI